MAGLWCVNIGYGRKELAEAAYRQMLDLPYYNTFFKTTTVPATRARGKDLILLPERFKQVFFVNSGSEANDTMVRFVRHYWALKGKPYRNQFIARRRGYHGSTMVVGIARRHGAACTARAACRCPASITCCSPIGTSSAAI